MNSLFFLFIPKALMQIQFSPSCFFKLYWKSFSVALQGTNAGYFTRKQPFRRRNTRMKHVLSGITTLKIMKKCRRCMFKFFYNCFSATYIMHKELVLGFAAICMCSVRVGIMSRIYRFD